MSDLRQALLGISAALLATLILFGGLLLSFTEAGTLVAVVSTPTATITLTSSPLPPLPTQPPGEPTYTPSPTLSPTPTATFPPPPTACLPPAGWTPITVQPGDSLESIAQAYGLTPEALRQANCLVVNTLAPDSIIYVPPLPPTAAFTATLTTEPTAPPAPTRTSIPCGPPRGWVTYRVRSGDTLSRLSQIFGVSVAQLQRANCLGNSTRINTGQLLYVPFLPPTPVIGTRTQTPTLIFSPTPQPSVVVTTPAPSNTPRPTNTPVPPTRTPVIPTNTPVPPTVTNTPVPPTVTNTPVPPTDTHTPIPPTDTHTPIPPTETHTPVPPADTNTPDP